jgi:hypothetical protein
VARSIVEVAPAGAGSPGRSATSPDAGRNRHRRAAVPAAAWPVGRRDIRPVCDRVDDHRHCSGWWRIAPVPTIVFEEITYLGGTAGMLGLAAAVARVLTHHRWEALVVAVTAMAGELLTRSRTYTIAPVPWT